MSELKSKRVIVLATSHQFQGSKFLMSIDDPCYRKIVEQLILGHEVDFVFEEAAGRAPTYAEETAKKQLKPIGYMDIDPSRSEREKYGLSEETGGSYPVDLWESPPCVAQEEDVEKHGAREEFWLQRIRSKDFVTALVVCGCAHGLSLSFRLRGAGFNVQLCINYMPYDKLCGHVK
jgi:hypothetical protein